MRLIERRKKADITLKLALLVENIHWLPAIRYIMPNPWIHGSLSLILSRYSVFVFEHNSCLITFQANPIRKWHNKLALFAHSCAHKAVIVVILWQIYSFRWFQLPYNYNHTVGIYYERQLCNQFYYWHLIAIERLIQYARDTWVSVNVDVRWQCDCW